MKRKKGDICKETSKDSNLVVFHILTEDPDDMGHVWVLTVRIGHGISLDTHSYINVNKCYWGADRVWLVAEPNQCDGDTDLPWEQT